MSVVGVAAVSHHQLVEGRHHGPQRRPHDGECVVVGEKGDEITSGGKSIRDSLSSGNETSNKGGGK